ncbi:hypothetical protein MRX96_015776 [Rhipicephalus microplus]
MGLEMSKPHLRAELEADLKKICEGAKNAKDVLRHQVNLYRDVFYDSERQIRKLGEALKRYLGTGQRSSSPPGPGQNNARANSVWYSNNSAAQPPTRRGGTTGGGGRRCGICNEEGHDRRRCPQRPS